MNVYFFEIKEMFKVFEKLGAFILTIKNVYASFFATSGVSSIFDCFGISDGYLKIGILMILL